MCALWSPKWKQYSRRRNMFNLDGTFHTGHMNNWQHAAMYFAFMVSGFVDLAGFYTELPPDSEQVSTVADGGGYGCGAPPAHE